MSRSGRRFLLVGVLWLAFGLRLFHLAGQSLWWDEGISLHLATSSLAEITANRVVNIHPPLYFWGLKGWVALLGVSAFSGRLLSVFASLWQLPLVYALARRWAGNGRTAWVALLLMALSPLSLIYGQETRVYAILPLIYLALLFLTGQIVSRQTSTPLSPRLLAVLGGVIWVGLHLHYIAIFAVLYVNGWAIVALGWQHRWSDLRRWLMTQLITGAASLPWAVAVIGNWGQVQAEAGAGTYLAQPVPWQFLVAQVWAFHLTGLPGALGWAGFNLVAGGTAVLLACLLIIRLLTRQTRRETAVLLAHWLIPLTLAILVWSLRSFSHPRYISMYATGLIPLAAGLIAPSAERIAPTQSAASRAGRWSGQIGGWLVALALLWLSGWALRVYFFHPTLAKKDDVRGVAQTLAATATAADLILVPDSDWSLPFEYEGSALVAMPQVADPPAMWANLATWTETRRRVFTMTYPRNPGPDWPQAIPFALETAGNLVQETAFDGLVLREYWLEQPVRAPVWQETEAGFAGLSLTGSWLPATVTAHNGVTVALRWQVAAPLPERLAAQVWLWDVDGRSLAETQVTLVDSLGRPTEQWAGGTAVTTYAFLPLSTGTPPLSYTVALDVVALTPAGAQSVDVAAAGIRPEQRWPLGTVQLLPATTPAVYAPDTGLSLWSQSVTVAPGLQLLAAEPERDTLAPGEVLFVWLQWQATEAGLPDYRPEVVVGQNGRDLAVNGLAPAGGRYPTPAWSAGEVVVERRQLDIPATATGVAELVLRWGETAVSLGTVQISGVAHLFDRPVSAYALDVSFGGVGRLVGYDLPETAVSLTATLPLTLYWQSLTTGMPVGYTVFVHALGDGQVVGQHDGVPGNGRRPTTGWIAGEYIADPHPITFATATYTGEMILEVGLYDPALGTRLLTATGQDVFYLPLQVMTSHTP